MICETIRKLRKKNYACFHTDTIRRFGLPKTTEVILVINVKAEFTKKDRVSVV